jgi:cytochrome P450
MHLDIIDAPAELARADHPLKLAAACSAARLADPLAYAEGGSFHPVWSAMQAAERVSWTSAAADHPGYWSVTGYDEIKEVLRDTERFSSEHGTILASVAAGGDPAGGLTITLMDPPGHTAVRAAIGAFLTLKSAQAAEPGMRARIRSIIGPWMQGGIHDVATATAYLSAYAFGEVIGILPQHWDELSRWTTASIAPEDPYVAGRRPAEAVLRDAHHHLFSCFRASLRARRSEPGDDIVTMLTRLEIGGRRLSEREQLLNIYSTVLGAGSTTPQVVNHLLLLMAQRPELWRRIRAGEIEPKSVIDEAVRWVTPTNHVVRRATCDTTIGGRTVRAGDWVCLWLAAANWDRGRLADADRFTAERRCSHLGFGAGPHICIGMHFAREALRAVIEELAPAVERISVAGPVRHLASTFINGITQLPLHFEAGSHGSAAN